MKPLLFSLSFWILLGQVCSFSLPECATGRRVNETWVQDDIEKRCVSTPPRGEMEIVVIACYAVRERPAAAIRIPVGTTQLVPLQGLKKCVETSPGMGELVAVKSRCNNGREEGDQWNEASFVKGCELDRSVTDRFEAVVIIKACIYDGMVIPVGESRPYYDGEATCKRADKIPEGVDAALVPVRIAYVGGYGARPAEDGPARTEQVEPTVTTVSPSRLTPPNCKDPKNLNKEVVEDKFVKACKKVRLSNKVSDIKFITIRCITPEGDEVAVRQNKSTASGVYDCQRLTYFRAKLVFTPSTVSTTPQPIALKCDNGRSVGEEWVQEEGQLIKKCILDPHLTADEKAIVIVKACFRDDYELPVGDGIEGFVGTYVMACKNHSVGHNVTLVEYLRIRCFTPERDEIEVGTSLRTAAGWYHCEPVHHSQGGMELKFEDANASTKNATTKKPVTTKPSRTNCKDPKNLDKEVVAGKFIRACKKVTVYGKPDIRFIVVRCITPEGATIALRKSESTAAGTYTCKALAHGMARLDFVKKATTPSPQSTTPAPTCANGLRVGEWKHAGGFEHICNKDLVMEVTYCEHFYESGKKLVVKVGDTLRLYGTQYSCERRGSVDAELVQKSFSQLCEEGDLAVDAWVSEGVLRDCVRTGLNPIVYARMCEIEDTLVEVGQNLEHEFLTYRCEVRGDFDAQVTADKSRIHPNYFNTPGVCMNGKKEGDEWTDRGVLRACRKGGPGLSLFGQSAIVDLGCVNPNDGSLVPVGEQARWKGDGPAVVEFLHCDKGQRGFGAQARRAAISNSGPVRGCENKRAEGEEWEDRNVLRTCKEVNDELAVVAIRCVLGNETLEIGENKITSDVSSVECVRVGEHDAALIIDIAKKIDKECENGKRLNEEWTDNQSRKACRIRNNTATIVLLGCQLEDGRFFAIGEKETETHERPGYEEYHTTHCTSEAENQNGRVYKTTARSNERQDERSPCGENKHGAVWAKNRFLKKCEVIEGNVLSGVTIGCVTLKDTHMLVGQVLEEDEYHINCARNEDGKIVMHYSFSIKEESKAYHNHPH